MRPSRPSTLLERAKSPRTLKILARCAVSLGALAAVTGCDTKGFLSPPDQLGRFKSEPLVVPILKTLDPSVEENDKIFVNATAPTPADRRLEEVDYRISRNDLLSVGISDLVAPGQEQVQTRRVSENGMISLPYIGAIRAEGLTEIEFEQAVAQAYKDMQLIQNANVSVTVVEARGRSFEVMGGVARPAAYAIPEANFRVLDALVVGGDVLPNASIDYIYIIRRIEKPRPVTRPLTTRPLGAPTTTPVPNPGDLAPRGQLSQPPAPLASSTQKQDGGERALNLLADTSSVEPAMKANTGGSFVEPTVHPTDPITPPVESSHPILAQAGSSDRGFEFNAPTAPSDVRVIRIPYQALRDGDLNYNIPIRPYDVVWVQPLPAGVYYVYGHVSRPGVFTLAGQKVTIKQAIGGAGMFDELAIPQRTEIVRRIRPDHEIAMRIDLQRIFNMEEPDVYLKPDDQIFVGTNAVAPFLAALRGAFRITYGFGFLYDRNFAYNNVAGAF